MASITSILESLITSHPLILYGIIYAVLGGLLPALIWLWFWLKEDRLHPEPGRMIFRAFLAGGLSVFLAFGLERGFADINLNSIQNLHLPNLSGFALGAWIFWSAVPFLIWALIEEFSKFVAAAFSAFGNQNYDEPIDAVIYLITAATGFAAVENSLFIYNALTSTTSHFDALITGNLRFLGASLTHIICSATVGLFIATAYYWRNYWKIFMSVLGVMVAGLLHAILNFFIIVDEGQFIYRVLITLWILAIVIIIFFEKIKHNKINHV